MLPDATLDQYFDDKNEGAWKGEAEREVECDDLIYYRVYRLITREIV